MQSEGLTMLAPSADWGALSPGRKPALSMLEPSGGYIATRLLSKFSGFMNLQGNLARIARQVALEHKPDCYRSTDDQQTA